MPKKKYVVDVTAEERTLLEQLLRLGKTGARKLTRARMLLKAASGLRDAEMAAALQTSPKHPGSSALLVNQSWTAPPA